MKLKRSKQGRKAFGSEKEENINEKDMETCLKQAIQAVARSGDDVKLRIIDLI